MTLTQSQAQAQSRPYVFVDGVHAMRPPAQHQNQQQQQQFVVPRQLVVASGTGGGAHKNGAATAHPKVATFPISSASENKNSNDRDKNREDTVMVTHDREVRLFEGSSGSLYSLCRSWVRNGLPQDIQAHTTLTSTYINNQNLGLGGSGKGCYLVNKSQEFFIH